MCIRPNTLDCGTEVACRECWQCRKRRVNDLVGRCIAESKFSQKTYAITLTYKPSEGVNAVTLIYKDVQDFLKRLRKKYKCRYIVTGEYGSAKGRAHWHIIVFFGKQHWGPHLGIPWFKKPEYPEVDTNKRVDWKFWPHGLVYFQEPDWKGFEYCLKYVLKDQTSRTADSHLAMSKKPPLGAEYFEWLADEHVAQGLAPQTYFYKFGDVRDAKNRDKSFIMTGKTKENFMERFLQKWVEQYDAEPLSEIVDEYFDKITEIQYTDEELIKRLHYKPVRYTSPAAQQWEAANNPMDYAILHELVYRGIPLAVWEYDDKFHIITENDEWQEDRKEVVEEIKKRSRTLRKRSASEIRRKEWQELENNSEGIALSPQEYA